MTTAARINNWLKGNRLNPQEPILIYAQIGGPYPYSHFSPYIHSPFIPDLIEQQLEEIFRAWLQANPESASDDNTVAVRSPQPQVIQKDEPKEIVQLRERGKLLLKQQSFLHAQLSADVSTAERYDIAKELVEKVVPAIDRTYNTIRQYERTGEVPAAAADVSLKSKIIALINKQKSLESRISRLKGKLSQKLTPEDKVKYEKELLEKQHALLEIEKELS